MTPKLKSLLEDARLAGYKVTSGSGGTIKIIKNVGRWKKPEGLIIYPDGTAFLADARLDVARGVRSYKAMQQLLGI